MRAWICCFTMVIFIAPELVHYFLNHKVLLVTISCFTVFMKFSTHMLVLVSSKTLNSSERYDIDMSCQQYFFLICFRFIDFFGYLNSTFFCSPGQAKQESFLFFEFEEKCDRPSYSLLLRP